MGSHGAGLANLTGCRRREVAQALHPGDSGIEEEFVTIARVFRTQGRRGEVAAELHTDFPELFQGRRHLFALFPSGVRRELDVELFWQHKSYLVLKFVGVGSISEAESLVGCELQIPTSQRAELEAGAAYVSDLVGCTVLDRERELGAVTDVRFGAGEAPLLVVQGVQEYEIPFAEAYLAELDIFRKRIKLRLPDGLLEVNAPLTDEEKQQQRK
ncbi:MAG: 16S rRNA processing protein RimM [Acidobacteria bacterium]|nr:16S rRNA processing protein RimM [Acidobacteriota bacterium]